MPLEYLAVPLQYSGARVRVLPSVPPSIASAQMKWTASYGADPSSSLVSSVNSTMSVRDQYAPSLRRPLARATLVRMNAFWRSSRPLLAPYTYIYIYILSHCYVMHDAVFLPLHARCAVF